MKNISTWKLVNQSLEDNVPVMLLYVLESKGSSPGRQGFFMAVNARGEMEGSIGGGIMEHKFVEMAREKLLAVSDELLAGTLRKQIHDKQSAKNQSGMICSGEQTILLYRVQEKDASPVRNLVQSLETYENGILALTPEGIEYNNGTAQKNFEFCLQSENDWTYKEKTGYKNRLFIIGGGHCSLAFSKLMSQMDYYISIYDERKDLKTLIENETAHEKYLVNDYAELKEMIPAGNDHYVVIMTFGYRTDDKALRALLDKDFKYIGLLGSKVKIEKMFSEYRKEGIAEDRLQRIHTPVGLAINSQTPEEIAVSIAAEIIQEKNKDAK
jgi:xanthine dehydrogenase accessory factor